MVQGSKEGAKLTHQVGLAGGVGRVEADLVSDGAEDADDAILLGGPGRLPGENTIDGRVGLQRAHEALGGRRVGAAVQAKVGDEVGGEAVGLDARAEVAGPLAAVGHDTAVEGGDKGLAIMLVVRVVASVLLEDGQERAGVSLVQDGHVEGEQQLEVILSSGLEEVVDGAESPRVDNILDVEGESINTQGLGVTYVGLSLLD